MSPSKRFFLGGVGAILPIIVSILTLDLATSLSLSITLANVIGTAIRYGILFFLGGFVAYLHDDENKSFKLVELGIAAPALITSLVAGHAASAPPIQNDKIQQGAVFNFSIISSANADTGEKIVIAGFFADVLEGVTGGVYSNEKNNAELQLNTKINSATNAAVNTLYEIKATAQTTGKITSYGPEYKFTIFINSSPDVLQTIKQVEYGFFHSTFKNKRIVSDTIDNKFSYSYTGWGCLTFVATTIVLKDGTSRPLDFNMCQSLGPKWNQ